MRYCAKCGFENDDGAMFCTKCGVILNKQTAPVSGSDKRSKDEEYYEKVANMLRGKPTVEPSEVISIIKDFGSNAKVLLGNLLMTAAYILSWVALALSLSGMTAFVNGLGSEFAIFSMIFIAMGVFSVIILAVANIPPLFTLLGLWITYFNCKNRQKEYIGTAGLTIIKVINRIIQIIMWFSLVLSEALIIVYVYQDTSRFFSGLFAMGITALVFGIIIHYLTALLVALDTIRSTVVVGFASDDISNYIVIMNYVLAAFAIIGGVLSIVMAFVSQMNISYLITGLTGLCFGASGILFMMALSGYKNKMKEIMIQNAANRSPYDGSNDSIKNQTAKV